MLRWFGTIVAALLLSAAFAACPSDWPVDDDSAGPADDDVADDDVADDDSAA